MQVIFQILTWFEERPETWYTLPGNGMPDFNFPAEVDTARARYHFELCQEAGYVRVRKGRPERAQITWAGHEKLDEMRAQRGG